MNPQHTLNASQLLVHVTSSFREAKGALSRYIFLTAERQFDALWVQLIGFPFECRLCFRWSIIIVGRCLDGLAHAIFLEAALLFLRQVTPSETSATHGPFTTQR